MVAAHCVIYIYPVKLPFVGFALCCLYFVFTVTWKGGGNAECAWFERLHANLTRELFWFSSRDVVTRLAWRSA
jgi:hypothetical protein